MRVGELLALTLQDIDFKENKISINKGYYRITGKDLIDKPKTIHGERVVDIPDFLTQEIREYVSHLYEPDPAARLFEKRPQYVRSVLRDRNDHQRDLRSQEDHQYCAEINIKREPRPVKYKGLGSVFLSAILK